MKKDFRKQVIESRKNKDSEFISINSQIITEKLLSMNCIQQASTIMLYLDFNNEVKTDQLITKLISLRKTVTSPVTIKDERKLIPYEITNLKEGIKIGAYGIREPNKDISNEIDVKNIDVLIVPAVAYDKNCYRLGYGGGYYDRFIERLRDDAITIGIAFDLQLFDSIPKEEHDAQLNYIITESSTYVGKNKNL
jgi:5-formyltetrahydrofolate cyclo-ligase